MQGKFKVITLCGSMRFREYFIEAQRKLSLEGNIVLLPVMHPHHHFDENYDPEYIDQLLIDMHNEKMDMSDEIFVVNPAGYIGESTRREINYAISKGKPVKYLDEPKEN